MIGKAFLWILDAVLIFLVGLAMYMIIVWLPVSLINQQKCYDNGYPVSSTTLLLRGYCKNIDGSVKGIVVPVE